MKFYTTTEYTTTKLYELDDTTYNKIRNAFVKAIGAKIADIILDKYMESTIKELSLNSYVDVMSCVSIING